MLEAGPYRVAAFDTLGSTNDEAMARLKAGDPGRLFVVATSQTGGRGRRGRTWVSPPGNLYASLALIDPSPRAIAPQLGFVAGVALALTLRAALGGDPRLKIKWPNDILFDGGKLAGILLESATSSAGRLCCVVGFGVNCLSHPIGLPYRVSNLKEAGQAVEAGTLLVALALELERQLTIWNAGDGFAAIRASWLSLAAGFGEPASVVTAHETHVGLLRDLDASGRLVIDVDGRRLAIDAGDVFLPDSQTRDGMNETA